MAKPAATPLAFKQDADCTEPVAFATHCRPFRKESRYFRRGVLVGHLGWNMPFMMAALAA